MLCNRKALEPVGGRGIQYSKGDRAAPGGKMGVIGCLFLMREVRTSSPMWVEEWDV